MMTPGRLIFVYGTLKRGGLNHHFLAGQKFDALEGLADGLYRRERVPLLPPFAERSVEAYLYPHDITGRREIGSVWRE